MTSKSIKRRFLPTCFNGAAHGAVCHELGKLVKVNFYFFKLARTLVTFKFCLWLAASLDRKVMASCYFFFLWWRRNLYLTHPSFNQSSGSASLVVYIWVHEHTISIIFCSEKRLIWPKQGTQRTLLTNSVLQHKSSPQEQSHGGVPGTSSGCKELWKARVLLKKEQEAEAVQPSWSSTTQGCTSSEHLIFGWISSECSNED